MFIYVKTQQKLINTCKNSNVKKILRVTKDPFKPLFVGAKTFIQTTKKGDALFVYAIPTFDFGMQQHDYKCVFEKKNANTLP